MFDIGVPPQEEIDRLKAQQDHLWLLKSKWIEYMCKPLKPDGRMIVRATFVDKAGNLHTWVPEWNDILTLTQMCCFAEIRNKPDSRWIDLFRELGTIIEAMCKELPQISKTKGEGKEWRIQK